MSKSIHGHEVLRFMLASEHGFTRSSLVTAIEERFGLEARFHTCSAEDMTAAQLVDFLEARGKFVPAPEGGFNTAPERICGHE